MLPCFLEINGCFKGRIPQIYWTNKFNQIWGFEEQTMVNRVTAWRDSLAHHRYMGMRGWTRHVWSFSWYQFVSGMCQSRYCLMNQQRIVRVQSLICCSAWSGAWRSAVFCRWIARVHFTREASSRLIWQASHGESPVVFISHSYGTSAISIWLWPT